MDNNEKTYWWAGFTFRESLVAGFCAVLIVLSELFLRIPMHVPGHRVLPLAFLLLLGRACVRPAWSATLIGVIAGIVIVSVGPGGLSHFVQYPMAGVIADLASLLLPAVSRSVLLSGLAGALVGASWLPVPLLVDRLAGLDTGLALSHSLIRVLWGAVFGAIGGALVPPVARRLRASGLLPTRAGTAQT